jgi:hypothetical protein
VGTWGDRAFQNDSALDWLADLEVGGVAELRITLSRVADTHADDDVDVDDGAAAIAAAEIVAAALGHGMDRLTSSARAWLEANDRFASADDGQLAWRAVNRVLTGRSELRALRAESAPDTAWHTDVRALLGRLQGSAGVIAPIPSRAEQNSPRAKAYEREKQVLVTFLSMRGLEPNAQQLERIRTSRDEAEIRCWLARALDAPSIAEVLDD